jgi:hypothetical protein
MFQRAQAYPYNEQQYEKWFRMREELKYKLLGVQKIRISVDIGLGLPRLQGQKMQY